MTNLAPASSTGNASRLEWTGLEFVLEHALFLELLAEIRTWYYIFVLVFNCFKCTVHLRMNFIVYF